ncbi:MAG: hypothetical protein J0G33_15675 [Afipia felis]|nr:hypothetical protein [Afipia felis]
MQTSVFLAKLIGPTMTAIALAVLFNRDRFQAYARDIIDHPVLLFLSSIVFLPAGIAIALVHNVWSSDWRVLITIFGWLLIVSSLIRLLAPGFVVTQARNIVRAPSMPAIAGGIWLVIGLIFCFFGYR